MGNRNDRLVPLALTDLSTGEELLVWGVEGKSLDGLLRAMDAAAKAAGAVGAAMVDPDGEKALPSEVNRAWIEEGPKVIEEAQRATAAHEGGREQ